MRKIVRIGSNGFVTTLQNGELFPIEPGDYSSIEEFLSKEDSEKVKKIWTSEVISAWETAKVEDLQF